MLSAVAARKARLQQKPPPQNPQKDPEPSPSPSPEPEDVLERAKPPSKRKSAPPNPKPLKKKRKVNRPGEKKVARYFLGKDGFKEQEDVIIVDDDDEESDSSSSGESLGERPLAQSQPSIPARARRAWSPSEPLQDSSDEEEADAALEEQVLNPPTTPRPTELPPELLSTFQPILNQNFFHVSEEELQPLGITSSAPTKLLVLRPSDRLALLGTYSITILRGSIRLNGVHLTPSLDPHQVFAPRSSPLPVIDYASGIAGHDLLTTLPAGLVRSIDPNDAAILIQELKTGVEGLGRVCKTFEDVFKPTRWQRNQTTVDLGLEGVYYVGVCLCSSLSKCLYSWKTCLGNIRFNGHSAVLASPVLAAFLRFGMHTK